MRVGHVLTEHALKFQDEILYPIAAACKGATVVRFLIKRILQALFLPVATTLLVAFVIRLFFVQCRRFSRKDFITLRPGRGCLNGTPVSTIRMPDLYQPALKKQDRQGGSEMRHHCVGGKGSKKRLAI